jgi:putative phosphoesterase
MLLGLLTDTHDNLPALDAALTAFRSRGVRHVLHAGDITAPATVERLKGFEAVLVFGNNDRDRVGLLAAAVRAGATIGDGWQGELGGLRIAVEHGDRASALTSLVRSGRYDVVVTGHTHRLRDERFGRTRVINPGALYRASRYTCGVLDTRATRLEIVDVRGAIVGGMKSAAWRRGATTHGWDTPPA